jgi:hypothetical protein
MAEQDGRQLRPAVAWTRSVVFGLKRGDPHGSYVNNCYVFVVINGSTNMIVLFD